MSGKGNPLLETPGKIIRGGMNLLRRGAVGSNAGDSAESNAYRVIDAMEKGRRGRTPGTEPNEAGGGNWFSKMFEAGNDAIKGMLDDWEAEREADLIEYEIDQALDRNVDPDADVDAFWRNPREWRESQVIRDLDKRLDEDVRITIHEPNKLSFEEIDEKFRLAAENDRATGGDFVYDVGPTARGERTVNAVYEPKRVPEPKAWRSDMPELQEASRGLPVNGSGDQPVSGFTQTSYSSGLQSSSSSEPEPGASSVSRVWGTGIRQRRVTAGSGLDPIVEEEKVAEEEEKFAADLDVDASAPLSARDRYILEATDINAGDVEQVADAVDAIEGLDAEAGAAAKALQAERLARLAAEGAAEAAEVAEGAAVAGEVAEVAAEAEMGSGMTNPALAVVMAVTGGIAYGMQMHAKAMNRKSGPDARRFIAWAQDNADKEIEKFNADVDKYNANLPALRKRFPDETFTEQRKMGPRYATPDSLSYMYGTGLTKTGYYDPSDRKYSDQATQEGFDPKILKYWDGVMQTIISNRSALDEKLTASKIAERFPTAEYDAGKGAAYVPDAAAASAGSEQERSGPSSSSSSSPAPPPSTTPATPDASSSSSSSDESELPMSTPSTCGEGAKTGEQGGAAQNTAPDAPGPSKAESDAAAIRFVSPYMSQHQWGEYYGYRQSAHDEGFFKDRNNAYLVANELANRDGARATKRQRLMA